MQRTRPTPIVVIAILHLVFGGLWLLCGLATLGIQASGMNNMFMNMGSFPTNNPQLAKQQEIQKEVMKFSQVQSFNAGQYASLLQYVVLSILMIISAIGLLKLQPWGRVLSMVYATLSILSNIAIAVYIWVITIPAVQAFADRLGAQVQEAKAMVSMIKFFANFSIITPIVSLVYPMIVLTFMLRPSIAAAFRAEADAPSDTAPRSNQFEVEDRWGQS